MLVVSGQVKVGLLCKVDREYNGDDHGLGLWSLIRGKAKSMEAISVTSICLFIGVECSSTTNLFFACLLFGSEHLTSSTKLYVYENPRIMEG